MNQRRDDDRIIILVADMEKLQEELSELRKDVLELKEIMTRARGAIWLVRAAAIVVASCAAAWTWVTTNAGWFRVP